MEIKEIELTKEQMKIIKNGIEWTRADKYGNSKSDGKIGEFFGCKLTVKGGKNK